MFLINGTLEFWPKDNLLLSHRNRNISSTLSGPATRCLTLLLQKAPEIVSPEEFFDVVWKPEGMIVPPNTLYQNISLIRRGIKNVTGDDFQVVETVLKKGFKINEEAEIAEFPELTDPDNAFPGHTNDDQNMRLDSDSRGHAVLLRDVFLMVSLLFISVVGFWGLQYFSQSSRDKGNSFFSPYTISEDRDGCHFLRKEDSLTYQALFSSEQFSLDCKRFPWVYVTRYHYIPTSSVIGCEKSPESSPRVNCVSVIFREGIK